MRRARGGGGLRADGYFPDRDHCIIRANEESPARNAGDVFTQGQFSARAVASDITMPKASRKCLVLHARFIFVPPLVW